MRKPVDFLVSSALATTLLLTSSACLRTRSQIREEGSIVAPTSSGEPVAAQVQDVEPKGQYVIEELKSELVKMTGRIEDLERASKDAQTSTSKPTDELIRKLETRIQELEVAQADVIEQLKKVQASAPVAENPELIQTAKKQIEAGELDSAIDSLTQYLKNPKAKGTEEATFLRAEALYQQKQYKRAIADYALFPEKFNRSKKLPAALYKIGLSFLALNSKDDANAFFQELIQNHPKTPEAQKARTKLAAKSQ